MKNVFQTKNIAGMDWKEEDSRTVNLFDEDVIFSVVFIFPLFIHSNTLIANNAILVRCLTVSYKWVGGSKWDWMVSGWVKYRAP